MMSKRVMKKASGKGQNRTMGMNAGGPAEAAYHLQLKRAREAADWDAQHGPVRVIMKDGKRVDQ